MKPINFDPIQFEYAKAKDYAIYGCPHCTKQYKITLIYFHGDHTKPVTSVFKCQSCKYQTTITVRANLMFVDTGKRTDHKAIDYNHLF